MATAYYPASIVNFGPDHQDFIDTILAAHPNAIQAEVVAVETVLGVTPALSTSPSSTGTFATGVAYPTVSARLANIEQGIVADTHTQYVKKTGSSITGNLTFNGIATVTGLPLPVNGSDAATKNYVDTYVSAGSGISPLMLIGA